MYNHSKFISGASTAVIILLVVLLLHAFGYDPPDPPIPEEGVEVNVGDSDFGQGENPEPASQAANYAPPAAQEQVLTQRTEATTPMHSNPTPGNVTNPAAVEKPKVENKEPEINKNALFPGKRNQNGGGSQGNSQGQGNQGKPDGNPNSNNYNGGGGRGGSFSLVGRSAVSLPKPVYNTNQQGMVVIRIWVNQQGRVTRAEYEPKGSNTSNGELVANAKAAAMKAVFNADAKAQEEQRGTITYIFKL